MNGELQYFHVAMLDVLGYKELLERDKKNATYHFKDSLEKAMAVFQSVNENEFSHKAISDTIVVVCLNSGSIQEFMRLLKKVFLSFLRESLLIRGAVVYAPHFVSGHVTYSPALSEAYFIEKDRAVYPRIVISESMAEVSDIGNFLCSQNGIKFIDVLDESNWIDVYKWAKSLFKQQTGELIGHESVFQKYLWFHNYLFSSPCKKSGYQHFVPPIKFSISGQSS